MFEPEIEIILAVYRRARLDVVYEQGRVRRDAEAFLLAEGFDPAAARVAWLREPRMGRPRRER